MLGFIFVIIIVAWYLLCLRQPTKLPKSEVFELEAFERHILAAGAPLRFLAEKLVNRLPETWLSSLVKNLKWLYRNNQHRLVLETYLAALLAWGFMGSVMILGLIVIGGAWDGVLFITGLLVSILSYIPMSLMRHINRARIAFNLEFKIMLEHFAVMSNVGIHAQYAYKHYRAMVKCQTMKHMLGWIESELQRGLTFYEAWISWQKIIQDPIVNRFVVLMSQGVKQGMRNTTSDLWQLVSDLERLVQLVAMQNAEKISTKLLLPMAISLIVLLVILAYPAAMQMGNF